MSKARVILRNVFSNWIGFFSEVCVAFFLSPFIIHSLGDTAYGIWVLLISLTGYFGLLNLGLRPAINKYVAEFTAKRDPHRLNEVINTALSVYTGIGLVIFLGSIGLSLNLDRLPFLPAELARANRWVVVIVGLQLTLSLPAVVLGGILSGLQQYHIHNTIGVSANLVRALLIIVLFRRHPTLMTLALLTLGTSAGSYLATIWAARRQCPFLQLRLRRPTREALLMLVRYSGITAVINLGSRLIYYSNTILVGGLISVAAVTHYAIATSVLDYARNLIQESTNVLNPAASELNAKGQGKELWTLWIYTTKATLVLVLPMVLGLIFLGKEFIVLWMGPNYSGSARILAILAASQGPVMAQYGTRSILYGLGRHQIIAKLTFIEAAINITLSIALGRAWGLVGIAWGSAIAAVVVGAIWLPWAVCRQMGLPLATYLRQSYLSPTLSAIPMAMLLFLMGQAFPSYSWPHLFGQAAVASCAYGLIAFFSCLQSVERDKVYSYVRSVAPSLGVQA